jgi:hypothetical protein
MRASGVVDWVWVVWWCRRQWWVLVLVAREEPPDTCAARTGLWNFEWNHGYSQLYYSGRESACSSVDGQRKQVWSIVTFFLMEHCADKYRDDVFSKKKYGNMY